MPHLLVGREMLGMEVCDAVIAGKPKVAILVGDRMHHGEFGALDTFGCRVASADVQGGIVFDESSACGKPEGVVLSFIDAVDGCGWKSLSVGVVGASAVVGNAVESIVVARPDYASRIFKEGVDGTSFHQVSGLGLGFVQIDAIDAVECADVEFVGRGILQAGLAMVDLRGVRHGLYQVAPLQIVAEESRVQRGDP